MSLTGLRRPAASTPSALLRMQRTRQRDTSIEIAVRRRVHALGYRYRLHPVLSITRSRPDFVFPTARVAVYVDSCFWHACPLHGTLPRSNRRWWRQKLRANSERDRRHNRELALAGWAVVRVWEHEGPPQAAARIAKVIAQRLQA
jgi:DNA mismatch endonuclease, patch repair protein